MIKSSGKYQVIFNYLFHITIFNRKVHMLYIGIVKKKTGFGGHTVEHKTLTVKELEQFLIEHKDVIKELPETFPVNSMCHQTLDDKCIYIIRIN